ncbi:MAG: PKD domain-containing protein, partial [Candidatus Margulisiibacteriota bacterium]
VDRSAHFEPETGEYVFDAHINTAGNQRVLMVVRDTAHSAGHYVTLDSGQFYISLGEAIDSVPPSASIASNLGDSYKVNAQVDRIVCRTNNPTATITWTITRPGLLDPADPTSYLQTFEGAIIPSYTFDVRGTYEFQCLVTTADRLLTNYDTRRVGVYPAETELPSGSIVAPTWARAGQSIDFVSPSADESLYSYTWIFHDGTEAATGPAVSHSFESPGTYAITLRITSLANPELQREYEHTITIIEADVDISTPSLSVVAPPAVHEGVEFPLTVGSIDTTHFTYQWELGDNPSLVNGASISYHYDAPGNYGVRIVATSMTNSEYVFYSPYYYIYVIAADSPLPELSIEAPLSAQVEHEVMFQLAADLNLADFGYTFDFGDGETEVVTDNSVPHIYHRTGIFQTILTAVSLGDGSVYRQTFNITIF